MAKTLLLADDSVTIQRVVELTFAHEDVRVVSMSDGQRAVSWLDSEKTDIVLDDVAVPEVDRYSDAAHVKQSPRLKHVPVLLLAGAFEPVDEERSKSIGCDGVVVKPFEPKQLVDRVKDLLSPGKSGKGKKGEKDRADSESSLNSSPVAPIFGSSIPGGPAVSDPQPLELPTRPLWDNTGAPNRPAPAPEPAPAPAPHAPPKVSLVNAFSALLAAEKSNAPAAPPPAPAAAVSVSEAAIEDAVHRVLERMTEDMVRRIVLETAERLVREEIEKIKANPE
jgi:CheY-like chemotaxis protein